MKHLSCREETKKLSLFSLAIVSMRRDLTVLSKHSTKER